MKCASSNCSFADLTTTEPCVVCGQGVHRICSNELYDAGSLSERFCSASCLYQWKTVTSPPSMSDLGVGGVPLLGRREQVHRKRSRTRSRRSTVLIVVAVATGTPSALQTRDTTATRPGREGQGTEAASEEGAFLARKLRPSN
ncbi:hypothetical protein PR001_g9071 [Phytophthora rubi]|uniref:Uncharacterized protein n=1 Tax=Phytophthora rubi TaxID=129364 RepID=A0A6A3N3T3_9STRA|nr:hypothetical protein PR001_g9071 [Phytophthora rubi]